MRRKRSTTINSGSRLLTLKLAAKMAKALAIALMFWCAGAGCMMVAYAKGAMAEMDSPAAADGHAMAHMSGSMDAHACCKAKRRGAKRSNSVAQSSGSEITQLAIPAPVQSSAMSCCPLTTGSIVVASRSTSNDEATALSSANSSAFKLLTSKQKPLVVPLRLPNRAESYLLDCAFLI
jgi:hypothetical protein